MSKTKKSDNKQEKVEKLAISKPEQSDDLKKLEGIDKVVEKILHAHHIYTFEQLARADKHEITRWLNEGDLKMMDPKTWPQQARLADIVKEFANEDDRRSYEAYKAWLKGGIEPDKYQKDESDRRAAALVWHGNAELTERAYPEIFGEK